eukprot:Em0007g1456a
MSEVGPGMTSDEQVDRRVLAGGAIQTRGYPSSSDVTIQVDCSTAAGVVVKWQASGEVDVLVQIEYNYLEDLHLCCFRVTIVLAEKICSFHSLHMRCIFLMRSKYTIFTKCLVVWILYNHCHWYFQYNHCDCYCYCYCWTTTATARTTNATVPSAITGLFVEATTNPTFTFTMVAGSPAERMTVAIVTLAVTTISLILLAIRKCIVRKDGDERAGPTDVFESVKVHPSPQKIDAAFLGNLPNLEQNDMSFSDALVTTPEGFIQNGLDEMFDGMNLDKSRTDYVDESMFLREASDQES